MHNERARPTFVPSIARCAAAVAVGVVVLGGCGPVDFTPLAHDPPPMATSAPSASPTPLPTIVPAATGLFVNESTPSAPNYGQYTVPIGAVGVPETMTFAPASATYSITLDPATCGSGATAVVTVTAVNSNSFAVTGNAAGICETTVTSPNAVGIDLWFTVNVTGFSVQ